jgi:ElaB/YqjD/DUF883 family membrane-anchored ribosome-binding protein
VQIFLLPSGRLRRNRDPPSSNSRIDLAWRLQPCWRSRLNRTQQGPDACIHPTSLLHAMRDAARASTMQPTKDSEMNASDVTPGQSESESGVAGIGRKGNGAGFLGGRRDAESLRNQLSHLKTELDSLVQRATTMGDEELSQAHDEIMARFSSMRHAARGMATQASRQLKSGVDVTTGYVQEKPMQSVTVAAAVGIALGLLMSRR